MGTSLNINVNEYKNAKNSINRSASKLESYKNTFVSTYNSLPSKVRGMTSSKKENIVDLFNQAIKKSKNIENTINTVIKSCESGEVKVRKDLNGLDKNTSKLSKDTIAQISLGAEKISAIASALVSENKTSSISTGGSYASGTAYSSSNTVSTPSSSRVDVNTTAAEKNISTSTDSTTQNIETIYNVPSILNAINQDSALYGELVEEIMKQYPNMSENDAKMFIENLSTSNVLTYSAMAGVVINSSSNIGNKFEVFNSFVDKNGSISDIGITLDVYSNVNGNIFTENGVDFSESQIDIGNWNSNTEGLLHNYFEANGIENVYVESSEIINANISDNISEQSAILYNEVGNQLINNENLILNVDCSNGITFTDTTNNTEFLLKDNKTYSLYVVGAENNNLIVKSFGKNFAINPNEVINSDYNLNVVTLYELDNGNKIYL